MGDQKKVLLVEDSRTEAAMFREMLFAARGSGYQLETVGSLSEGLERISLEKYDVAVIDLGLPDSMGLSTYESVRSASPGLPVIILSGLDDESVALEALRKGAQDYLVKGRIDANMLSQSIRYAIERKCLEQEKKESERRYRDLYEEAPEAYFSIGADGRIEEVNRRACELLGYERDQFLDVPVFNLYADTEHGREKAVEVFRRFRQGESVSDVELQMVTAGGDILWVSQGVRPVRDSSGDVVGSRAIVVDISKLKNAEAKAESHADDLRQMIDVAAHEFRHPATVFKGYATLLLEHGGDLEEYVVQEALKDIDEATVRLTRMINKLLDTSRIERGKMALDYKKVDPDALLRRSVQEIKMVEYGRGFNITGTGDCSIFEGDPERIRDVLINFLSNAANYSPPTEGIDVWCVEEQGHAVFRVADRGPGIPENDRDKIFERFVKLDDVLHDNPGIGLGLYIARSYVLAHEGWIGVEDREGGGSVFSFGIPLERPPSIGGG